MHHAHGAVNVGFLPFWVVREAVVAVALLVGFVDNVEAIVVVERIRAWVVRVVRSADGVEVVLLKHQHVLFD